MTKIERSGTLLFVSFLVSMVGGTAACRKHARDGRFDKADYPCDNPPDYLYLPDSAANAWCVPSSTDKLLPGVTVAGFEFEEPFPGRPFFNQLRKHLLDRGWAELDYDLEFRNMSTGDGYGWRTFAEHSDDAHRTWTGWWANPDGDALAVMLVAPVVADDTMVEFHVTFRHLDRTIAAALLEHYEDSYGLPWVTSPETGGGNAASQPALPDRPDARGDD